MRPAKERVLHGVKVALPEEWDDWTLYRFSAPDRGQELRSQMRVAAPTQGPKFRSNLIVSRHKAERDKSLSAQLESSAAGMRAQNPTCKLLASGSCEYLGQTAAWQDITFAEPSTRMQLFQRQIAVRGGSETVVLTLTTDRKDLDDASAEFGFTAPQR